MRLGPYETGKVYQGDCLELMKAIPSGSVPMIWTDPPYGHANQDGDLQESRVGVKGARQRQVRPIAQDKPERYAPLLMGFLSESSRVLCHDCCCCCCAGGGGPSPAFASLALWIDDALSFFHAVIWDKSQAGDGLGWRYRRNYEFVMVGHGKQGKLRWNPDAKASANVVRLAPPRMRSHPNEKPVELVRHFLRLHTKPGDLVLDPFAGSGTTGVACAQMGREFLGFELDEHWAEVANERIAAALRGLTVAESSRGQSTFDFFQTKARR